MSSQISTKYLLIYHKQKLWYSLKHQVFCRRQGDDIKPIRDNAGMVHCYFNTLHIFRCVPFPIFLWQPHTNQFSAKRFHAGENTPDIAAYLLTITPLLFCCSSSLYDSLTLGILNYLNKDACTIHFILILLRQLIYLIGKIR